MHIADHEFTALGQECPKLSKLAFELGMATSEVRHFIDMKSDSRYMLTVVDCCAVRIPLGRTQEEAEIELGRLAPQYTIPDIEYDDDGDPIDETVMCDTIAVVIYAGDVPLDERGSEMADEMLDVALDLLFKEENTVEHFGSVH